MNFFQNRVLPVAVATAAFSVAALVQTEAAHAFRITRTNATAPAAGINTPLATPTVINFNQTAADVSTTATNIATSTSNGNAQINLVTGSARYVDNLLQVGENSGNPDSRTGTVRLTFGHPRGMGYFGFQLLQAPTNAAQATISFFSGTRLIASYTMAQLLGNTPLSTTTPTYFNFFVTRSNQIFNEVRFADLSSDGGAGFLRVDNVAYQAIPTPALLPGLAGVAFGAIRKRKAEAEAEAEA